MSVKSTSVSQTTLAWLSPLDSGGCPILSYEVHVDDGALGPFAKFGASLSAETFTTTVTGLMYTLDYRFVVYAINEIGVKDSNIVRAVVAGIPNTPTSAPSVQIEFTTETSLRIRVAAVTVDGGTPITSY